ncbi:MAG: hypothetical protein Q7J35_15015 [Candidatus Methanoperedens sp.]|nr:hypothetical protein [Candidatus Methanoperedens sp.]
MVNNSVYKTPFKERLFVIRGVLDEFLNISYYRINNIRREDIVLDIGAYVGAFSLVVSRMIKHVYAVETIKKVIN